MTNNNFAKFSSSGYTNNAFLLMSGHHDFTQNDFNQEQPDRNRKSTSKPRPAQPNFGMGSRFSANEPPTHSKPPEKEEMEEIEEDIQVHQDGDSPGTPLINSRTKVKGKDLRLMKPPKPYNNRDTKASPINGKVFNNMRGADASHLTEIPEQNQSHQSKNVSHQQQDDTFDEFYPMPRSRQVLDHGKRPFSPPIKQISFMSREQPNEAVEIEEVIQTGEGTTIDNRGKPTQQIVSYDTTAQSASNHCQRL